MKKFGFTLSEIIITLGVVGVVAAITAPLIEGLMPDSNKAKVLKVYKTVHSINKELLNDRSLYIEGEYNNNKCTGFGCQNLPSNPDKNDAKYQGSQKYPHLLIDHLDVIDINYPDSSQPSLVEFKTSDGVTWKFTFASRPKVSENPIKYGYKTKFYVDFSTDGSGCIYDNSCLKPTRFRFDMNAQGKLVGDDPLTKAYLENPYKLNDRKKDYARAKEIKASKS